jgi:hypothetical protein
MRIVSDSEDDPDDDVSDDDDEDSDDEFYSSSSKKKRQRNNQVRFEFLTIKWSNSILSVGINWSKTADRCLGSGSA